LSKLERYSFSCWIPAELQASYSEKYPKKLTCNSVYLQL